MQTQTHTHTHMYIYLLYKCNNFSYIFHFFENLYTHKTFYYMHMNLSHANTLNGEYDDGGGDGEERLKYEEERTKNIHTKDTHTHTQCTHTHSENNWCSVYTHAQTHYTELSLTLRVCPLLFRTHVPHIKQSQVYASSLAHQKYTTRNSIT